MTQRSLLVTLFLVAVAATGPLAGEQKTSKTPAVATRPLDDLRMRVELLEMRVDSLEKVNQAAPLQIDNRGFAIGRTQYGPFLVNSKEATPYLDGYKVGLTIGNLVAAKFRGARLTVTWGRHCDSSDYVAWLRCSHERKTREFHFTDEFLPQKWTPVEITLAPAKPEEVKELFVQVEFDTVGLAEPQK
jgi:hypothetical protein